MLDAACGAGRWLRLLIERDIDAIGFDLSDLLLSTCSDLPVFQADMRKLPFYDGTFISVHSLFSSFGYFESVDEDIKQLSEYVRVLKPTGWLMLDTMPFRSLTELPPDNTFTFSDGVIATIHRIRKENVIHKTIHLDNGDQWEERLRLYSTLELDEMLSQFQMKLIQRFGDYQGSLYDEIQSRRVISCYVRTT